MFLCARNSIFSDIIKIWKLCSIHIVCCLHRSDIPSFLVQTIPMNLLNQKSRHQWVTRFFEFHFHCTKRNFPYLICADYDQSPQCHRYKRINMLVWLMNRRCWAFACFAHNIALYKHLLNMQISVHIFNNSIPDRRIFHAKLPYGCSGDLRFFGRL